MSTPRCKFSVGAAASSQRGKRAAEELPSEAAASKVPKASDIALDFTSTTQAKPKRLPASAPVIVCIYKITDEAGDVWDRYPDVPLWQIQIDHAAQRGVTFQMREGFNDFLLSTHATEKSIPPTLQELDKIAGVRLVVTDRTDPDDVGFVQWRVAFYVAGDLRNFLLLLDDWFKYKAKCLARGQPFEVHLHPHVGVDVADIWEDLEYEHYTLNEPAKTLPLRVFDAQPVLGKRIVTLSVQTEKPDHISIVVAGNTWNFRSRLDDFGVPGSYVGEDADRKYFRVLKDMDVSDEEHRKRILSLIGDGVFRNLAMRVTLDAKPEPDSHVEEFVAILAELPSLHFNACPA